MPSRKVLIVTYYWPPSGGVGVQRWMHFALELQQRGWEPLILTPQNPQFAIRDEQLLERVKTIPTFKLPIWEPFQLFHKITGGSERQNIQQGLILEKKEKTLKDRLVVWIRGNLFIPDPRMFWVKPAADYAIQLIREKQVDFMITTGPPHSMHLIGRRVRRKTPIKWLADFRDPWSKWDVLQKLNTSSMAMSIHRSLERSVLKECDLAVAVSNGMARSFGGLEVLTNGVSQKSRAFIPPNWEHFTIGYFGLLNELRNPTLLWMLLDQMCRESDRFKQKLKIRIGGIVSESIMDSFSNYHELKNKVEFLGYLSHDEIYDEYAKCHLLLLLQNKSGNAQWLLPVKFFEYLSVRRMMLCLGPEESDLGDIIRSKNVGAIFDHKNIVGLRSYIEDVFENETVPTEKDTVALLDRFAHSKLVLKLEELLMKMCEKDGV